jgi:hypothetical protein
MRGTGIALAAAGALAAGLILTFNLGRAHAAAAAPADDCWSPGGVAPVAGYACEHVFKDGTKCVVFGRPDTNNFPNPPALECKIT